jgi:hypothetical protein
VSELPPFGLGWPRTELRRQLVEAVLRGEKTSTTGLPDPTTPRAAPVIGIT